MITNSRETLLSNLSAIYPKHEWIDLASTEVPSHDTPIELNLQCLQVLKSWLEQSLGFSCEYEFPYLGNDKYDRAVSTLVNGFCLKVNGHKIVFIPSQNLDLESYEIPQEWIDLPNWHGEYYVAVQVDLEAQYLHLWGSISYDRVLDSSEFNSLFRYYHLLGSCLDQNLEVLWSSCEIDATNHSRVKASTDNLTAPEIQRLIQQSPIKSIPRLVLLFKEWGAILNDPNYLQQYLIAPSDRSNSPSSNLTNLSHWLHHQSDNAAHHWKRIESFIGLSQTHLAFRNSGSSLDRVLTQKKYRDISLETPNQVHGAIVALYRQQTEVVGPQEISDVEDLVTLIEQSSDENIRWKAAEYLWAIDPYHSKLPPRMIRDLGIQFATASLALMIAQLALSDGRRAILLRVYPMTGTYLPVAVKLSVFNDDSEPVALANDRPFEAVSRQDPLDNYIQLYFTAHQQDRFDLCIHLGTQQFVERFIV